MDSRILEVITYLAIIWIASSLTSPAAEITVTDMEIVSATLILEAVNGMSSTSKTNDI